MENNTEKVMTVKFDLTEKQIWMIVKEWYISGMYEGLLHDEEGLDLDEICENYLNQ